MEYIQDRPRGDSALDPPRVRVGGFAYGRIGIIDAGPGDVATNKKYLEGLGRDSGIDESPKAHRRRKAR